MTPRLYTLSYQGYLLFSCTSMVDLRELDLLLDVMLANYRDEPSGRYMVIHTLGLLRQANAIDQRTADHCMQVMRTRTKELPIFDSIKDILKEWLLP